MSRKPFKLASYSKTLYHGSPKRVANFGAGHDGKFGNGLYLTPDKSVAEFYAAGGRQGGSSTKLGGAGFIYQFKVSGQALVVSDLDETLRDMVGEFGPAEEAFSQVGDVDSPSISRHLAGWAEELGADLIVLTADFGVLGPLPQVLVVNLKAVKSKVLTPQDAPVKATAAEYQGKKVKLDQPYRSPPGSSKKFHVYVKDGSKVKKVSFGDPNMEIRRDNKEARDNFRSRHGCDSKKDKTTPGYWSCKMWESGISVTEMLASLDLPDWSPGLVHEKLAEVLSLAQALLPKDVFFQPTKEKEDDVPVLRILIGPGDPYTAERAGSFAFYSTVRGLEWYAKQVGELPPFKPGSGQVWVTLVDDADPKEQPLGVLDLGETAQAWAEKLVSWLS